MDTSECQIHCSLCSKFGQVEKLFYVEDFFYVLEFFYVEVIGEWRSDSPMRLSEDMSFSKQKSLCCTAGSVRRLPPSMLLLYQFTT